MKITFEFEELQIDENKKVKTKIELDDNEPRDMLKLKQMIIAEDLLLFISEFQRYLRSKYKYTEHSEKDLEMIWEDWHNMKSESIVMAVENL